MVQHRTEPHKHTTDTHTCTRRIRTHVVVSLMRCVCVSAHESSSDVTAVEPGGCTASVAIPIATC